jgi:hypothetical protein
MHCFQNLATTNLGLNDIYPEVSAAHMVVYPDDSFPSRQLHRRDVFQGG